MTLASPRPPSSIPHMATDRQRFVRLLRARHPLITICTAEEDRALEAVVGACVDSGRPLNTWTVVRGVYEGIFDTDHHAESGTEQPGAALRWCWQAGGGRGLPVLRPRRPSRQRGGGPRPA